MHPQLDLWSMAFVFVLATFVGFQVIQNVSRLLHTPLMSLTNAISAIAVVGVDPHRGRAAHHLHHDPRHHRRRRLDDQHRQRLPDHRPHAARCSASGGASNGGARHASQLPAGRGPVHPVAALAQSPLHRPARRRGRRRRHGRWPSSARCSIRRSSATPGSSSRWSIGTAIGVPLSKVPLTAVPQRTALSHAFGGLAAALVGTAKYALWHA